MSINARTRLPRRDYSQDSILDGSPGTGTIYENLGTADGYRKFDVAIAANFRIKSWIVNGTISTTYSGGPVPYSSSCNYNFTLTSSIAGMGGDPIRADEGLFASSCTTTMPTGNWLLAYINNAEAIIEFGPTAVPRASVIQIPEVGDYGHATLRAQFMDNDPAHEISGERVQTVSTFGSPEGSPPPSLNSGSIVVSVPGWRGVGTHSFTLPLYANDDPFPGAGLYSTTANFTMTGLSSYEWGSPAIWDASTAVNLRDPLEDED